MKNRYIILMILAVGALFATSCNKFLDELPDNRTELGGDKEKIRQLLVSAYPARTYAAYTNLMSDDFDDVGADYGGGFERFMTQAWEWQDDTEEDDDSPKETWEAFYFAIAHANMALEEIATLGNPADMDALRGEALMCRAFAHFKLVNLFCQHYSIEHSDTDMGIPYVEAPETSVNPVYERGTVKDVYEKIDRDIKAGLPLIDDTIYDQPKFHFNRLAALGFAAEFYLYYRDFDKTIGYANEVLGDNPELMMRDLTGFNSLPLEGPQYRAYVSSEVPANLMLVANISSIGAMIGPYGYGNRYIHSDFCAGYEGLLSSSRLWGVANNGGGMVPNSVFQLQPTRYYSSSSGGPVFAMRWTIPYIFEYTDPVAQIGNAHSVMIAVNADNVLLLRAEAYVLKEMYAEATADINHWVKKRIATGYNGPKTEDVIDSYYGGLAYYTSSAPTAKKRMSPEVAFTSAKQENFIHALLHLRRIEFFGEGSRWFDVKRYNIEITRREMRVNSVGAAPSVLNELDKMAPRDLRMAIQLPQGAITAGMEANPR